VIDLRAARNDPDTFRTALARKGAAEQLDELLDADRAVLDVQPRVEQLRARRKGGSGKPTPEQLVELERVKAELQQLVTVLSAANLAVSLVGVVVIVFMGRTVLSWFGPSFPAAYPVLLVLSSSSFVGSHQTPVSPESRSAMSMESKSKVETPFAA